MHIKLRLGLLQPEEAETYQKLLQLSLSHSRQTQPKREAWCNIIYTHTSYCHLFYTSPGCPSLAEWSPAKSPHMLQHNLSLLLGFTTSHSLVYCYIIPFPSLLPLFRGQGKCFQRVWGARAVLSWHGGNQHQGCSEPLGILKCQCKYSHLLPPQDLHPPVFSQPIRPQTVMES